MKYGIWDIKGKYWMNGLKSKNQFTESYINVAFAVLEIFNDYYRKFDKKLEIKIME